jgi:hypothetical protein
VDVEGEFGLRGHVGLVGGEEVLERMAGAEVVGGVLAFAGFDDAHPATATADGDGDRSSMGLAGLVLVGDDDDVGVLQVVGVLVAPLAGTTR